MDNNMKYSKTGEFVNSLSIVCFVICIITLIVAGVFEYALDIKMHAIRYQDPHEMLIDFGSITAGLITFTICFIELRLQDKIEDVKNIIFVIVFFLLLLLQITLIISRVMIYGDLGDQYIIAGGLFLEYLMLLVISIMLFIRKSKKQRRFLTYIFVLRNAAISIFLMLYHIYRELGLDIIHSSIFKYLLARQVFNYYVLIINPLTALLGVLILLSNIPLIQYRKKIQKEE